jgi:hypothetical protein
MQIQKRSLVLATLLTLLAPAAAFASGVVTMAGNSCSPGFGGTTIFKDDYAMGNQSTTATNSYICPVNLASYTTFSMTYARLSVDDRSATNNFACYIYVTRYAGSQYWSRTKFTCSTGGCNDPTTAYTGITALTWQGTDLPIGSTSLLYWDDNSGYRCDVPPSTGGWSGMSWIRSYYYSN